MLCMRHGPQPAGRIAHELIRAHQIQITLIRDRGQKGADQTHIVVQRQPRHHRLTRPPVDQAADHLDVVGQVVPRHPHSTRCAGGTGGELQQCGLGGRREHPLGRSRAGVGDHHRLVVAARRRHRLPHQGFQFHRRDDHTRGCLHENRRDMRNVLVHIGEHRRRDRSEHPAARPDRVERGHTGKSGRHDDTGTGRAVESPATQLVGHRPGELGQFGVAAELPAVVLVGEMDAGVGSGVHQPAAHHRAVVGCRRLTGHRVPPRIRERSRFRRCRRRAAAFRCGRCG